MACDTVCCVHTVRMYSVTVCAARRLSVCTHEHCVHVCHVQYVRMYVYV